MTCCGGNIVADKVVEASRVSAQADRLGELTQYADKAESGDTRYIFACPQIHCGSCIAVIEKQLAQLPSVKSVRVNLTLKRILLEMAGNAPVLPAILELERLGYGVVPIDGTGLQQSSAGKEGKALLRALAVAGFAAMNIMLLSVSNWSGADGPTRDLFHLISILIAVPAVAYSGQTFFSSAYKALRNGHLNMDVPISLAVLMALGMSIFETFAHGDEVYFDAAVSLLFFLLIGRYLDQIMRQKARNALDGLARLAARGANVILPSGLLEYRPLDEIPVGSRLRVVPGERIPLDGQMVSGISDFDLSIITGESEPVTLKDGAQLMAGTLNITAAMEMISTRSVEKSYLAEVSKMLQSAENGRGRYVQLADRMARLYAPAVHLLALLAFGYWMFATAGDWHTSIYIAVAVLIVTCPCALGLAVPVVHVIGSGRLFEKGILMRDGSALERLAETNHVVFDKTGTLTTDRPVVASSTLVDLPIGSAERELSVRLVKALARQSSHPSGRAIYGYLDSVPASLSDEIREVAGCGMESSHEGRIIRLGKPEWVAEIASGRAPGHGSHDNNLNDMAFAIEGSAPAYFRIEEELRSDAIAAVSSLKAENLPVDILSGDRSQKVERIADQLAIDNFVSNCSPAGKMDHIRQLQQSGAKKVLMIGDGINDAPSLALSHASMAPASASEIGRNTADFIFTRNDLAAIPDAYRIAIKARTLIKQNFGLAIAYNCIAVPLAFSGNVSPLIAAIAMSSSSLVVIANSMRLRWREKAGKNVEAASKVQSRPNLKPEFRGA